MIVAHDHITIQKMVEFMDSGAPFSIAFRTCDIQKDKGGEYIHYDDCTKHNHLTRSELKAKKSSEEKTLEIKKNPRHYENSSRNIVRGSNGRIIKIHLRLVRRFNNKIVL